MNLKNLLTSSFLIKIGIFLIATSLVLFIIFFYPVLIQEARYFLLASKNHEEVEVVIQEDNKENGQEKNKKKIVPRDLQFGIVIPKINANASVIKNVDYKDPEVYQKALTKGVAHAEGTKLPGQFGNIFIFSHSSVNFYEATRYNSVFYLLHKLEVGDGFYIAYEENIFKYKVTEKKVVNAQDIRYMENINGRKTATLMTCWPPGTTLRRLLILAEQVSTP